MDVKDFFKFTKEKVILFLVLFYLPSVVIFGDFATGIYSNLHVYLLIVFLIAAYLISCALCLIKQVNKFLTPTRFKLTVLAFFGFLYIFVDLPYFNPNILGISNSGLINILKSKMFTKLLDIPSILLQFYIYAGVIELIIKKAHRVEDIHVDFSSLIRKWWFWLIVIALICVILLL
ncbi:MAG: hypothetical protein KJ597_00925 [Nanoarchaeota archaeon]|nr:hypothetical protein [Nanoarchaeota archaeon]MBU1622114.1 hypothetical protein [Nanoarchaeota archaeon]